MATQVRQHALGKLETNKNRHVPDKIKPGETVDLAREKLTSTKRKRPTKCGNCGEFGHNRTQCVEAIIDCQTKSRRKQKL